MYRSVLSYWKAIKLIGREHTAYNPCDGYARAGHKNSTGCYVNKCFGDFGIVNASRNMLQQVLHSDVYSYLQTVSQPVRNPRVYVADRARTRYKVLCRPHPRAFSALLRPVV